MYFLVIFLLFRQLFALPSADVLATRLSSAIQISTVSTISPPFLDPSQRNKIVLLLKKLFPKTHQQLKQIPVGNLALLYEWKGSNPSLPPGLIMGHLDVVPVSPGTESQLTHPAFSGKIDDQFIWGRGTLDDKSTVLGILEATEALLTQSFKPQRTLYLSFGLDEEVGGNEGAKKAAEWIAKKNIMLDYVFDEGGIIGLDLFPGIKGAIAFIGTAEKGYATVEMTAKVPGGHSSMPKPVTAISTLMEASQKILAHPMPAKLAPPVDEMLKTLFPRLSPVFPVIKPFLLWQMSKSPEADASIRTTSSVTIVQAGDAENVIPGVAKAILNFRLYPGDTPEGVMEHLKKQTKGLPVEFVMQRGEVASRVSSSQSETFQLMSKLTQKIFPGTKVAPFLTIGGTDSRHFEKVTQNTYRFFPAELTAKDTPRIHGNNERISISGYEKLVRFYFDFIAAH